jgi:hypothetical protein
MGEPRILIRFLGCIFHGTGNSARLCQNFGIISGVGGLNPQPPPLGKPVKSTLFYPITVLKESQVIFPGDLERSHRHGIKQNHYTRITYLRRIHIWGGLCSLLLTKRYLGNQIKKNEMCGACSMYGGQKFVQGFGGEIWRGKVTCRTQA